jgi:predicted nucleotidyltransferase
MKPISAERIRRDLPGDSSRDPQRAPAPTDRLALLGLRGSLVDLLRYFAVHPDERVHLRRLEHLFGPKSASFQRDLRALVELGALQRVDAASRRVEYELVGSWSSWPAIRSLIAGLSDPVVLVREALRGVGGVDAAFVYGSQASGRARPDSDVDVFVLGDALDRRALHRSLGEVALLTGRQVNPGLYTRIKLAERLGRPDSPSRRFLRNVLAGPKTWVAGDEDALRPLATAAGLSVLSPLSA